MANVNFFSLDGGTTRYPIEDTEARSRIEQVYADNGVLGAKNLLKVVTTSRTVNGVTFTINRDNNGNVLNVTVNGTASAGTECNLCSTTDYTSQLIPEGDYIISDGGVGASNNARLNVARRKGASGTTNNIPVYGDTPIKVNYSEYDYYKIMIWVPEGATVNNLTFKPMIRLASDPDDTYQPYVMTNRELTETVNGNDVTVLVHSSQSSNVTLDDTTFARLRGSLLAFKFRFTTTSEIAAAQNIAYIALDFYPAIRAQNIVGLNVTTAGVAVIDIAGYSNNKKLYFQSRATIPADTTISISGVIDIG